MSARRFTGWMLIGLMLLSTACAKQPPPEEPPSPPTNADPVSGPTEPPAPAPSEPVQPTPAPPEPAPPPLVNPPAVSAPTRVEIAQWDEEGWRPITPLDAVSPPGSSQIRLSFSRPVDRASVEAALQLQAAPVRGYIQWLDDQTMLWYIESLPPRLDFLLGGARDAEGRPLPGGLPSLRVGEPPMLVRLGVQDGAEESLAVLPADIISADLAPTHEGINLRAWFPGTATYDWEPVDYFVSLVDGTVRPGRREGQQPRLPAGLQAWDISPSGQLVMGLMGDDIVMLELRGGRQQTFPGVVERPQGIGARHLAWSPDSRRIALLSGSSPDSADLVTIDTAGIRTVLLQDLPVPVRGSRLTWSPDGRYLLVGYLLVDLELASFAPLPHGPTPLGFWSPDSSTLLYTAHYWDEVYLVEPDSATPVTVGRGLPVGWSDEQTALLIRWSSSVTRYHPPGN